MARTFIRQDAQIGSTGDTLVGFLDNVALGVALETGAATVADDLNNLRSVAHHLKDVQGSNWYAPLVAPATLDPGTVRGVQQVGDDLHLIERKRALRKDQQLVDVTVPATQNYVVLGVGELPANTTASVGVSTTLGTIVATHGGTFGTSHDLAEVAGLTVISPRNLVGVVDGSSGDPILSGGRTVYGLLQGEGTLADGGTITASGGAGDVQVSFVRINATRSDLEAVPVSDIENAVVNFCFRVMDAFENFNPEDFINDVIVDLPAGTVVDRQTAYDNQGATPVDQTSNAILDLEGAGLEWQIRDDLEAVLWRVIEGSAGGTSEVEIGAAVDVFDVDAVLNDFLNGLTANSGGTRPITVGVNDGEIATSAGDLEVRAAGEMFLDDVNQTGSTWAQTAGIKLSEATADWDTFETLYGGEVSILEAFNIVKGIADAAGTRTKVQAILTADVSSATDVNGPGTPHNNTDVNLAPFDQVGSFVSDVEVYLNGELLRNDAASGGTNDVYPGGTPADGDLAFNFNLKGTGSKPDQLTVIVNGQ